MITRYANTLLILFVTLIVTGTGYYQVEVRQPRTLQGIEDQKKLARLQQAEMEQLFVEEATSTEKAEETMRRWRARYKYIPASLKTPDIIQYLEGLSRTGFEQFDVKMASRATTADYSYYLFDVSGTAYYRNLYDFVWQIENNRAFYQIHDMDVAHTNVFEANAATGLQARRDMVNFSMRLKVFFAGTEGLSARAEDLLPIPSEMLPTRHLPSDSFYPLVRTDLPPNDQLLVNLEEATLISIVGDRAIFQDKSGQHIVREGDAVYLGQIVKIDPAQATVRATLNKGGVIETVDVQMDIEAPYRQTQGVRLLSKDDQ